MPQPPRPPPKPQQKDNDPTQTVLVSPRPKKKRPAMLAKKPTPPPVDIHLSYSQSFRDQDHEEPYETEVISTIQFNKEGDLLAVGNRGGRIQVFKQDPKYSVPTYEKLLVFQSHLPEFDYLKSIEIEEKIIQAKWLNARGPGHYLLCANDKTIKLWKIGERRRPEYSDTVKNGRLSVPRVIGSKTDACSVLRKNYNNGHTFHVNSVSPNSDGQTFASSDDLRINVWDIERTDTSFVIVDMKPESMENLTEVITTSNYHPTSCNILAYGTSKGSTKLCDQRTSPTCDKHFRHYKEESKNSGFFVEVVGSISDIQFSNCGTRLATRDFMTTKIWDTRMESKSLLSIPVHEYLRPHLHTLYENDLIFDKFTLSWNHNDTLLLTGTYNDLFCVLEPDLGTQTYKTSVFETSEDLKNHKHHVLKPKRILDEKERKTNPLNDINIDEMELTKRTLITQWHPRENLVAAVTLNTLCLFNNKRLFFENNF